PLLAQVRTVLEAELERISGTRGPATLKLRDMARSEDALVLVHSTLLRSALANKQEETVIEQSQWLESHRGRRYVERPADGFLALLNVVDAAGPQPTSL